MAIHRKPLTLIALTLALVLAAAPAALAVNGRTTAAAVTRTQAYMGGDAFDSVDATWTTAPIAPQISQHTFYGGKDNNLYTVDQDWFKLSIGATGTPVIVNVVRTAGQGGSYIDVFDAEGTKCATESIVFGGPADPNGGARVLGGIPQAGWWASGMAKLYFTAPHPGTYYFRHRPTGGDLAAEGITGPGRLRDEPMAAQRASVSYEMHVIVGDADRIWGSNRYLTSVGVTKEMWNAADDPYWFEGPWGNGVILVSGQSAADGLAATSMSLRTGMPMLLVPRDGIPSYTLAEVKRLAAGTWWNHWGGDNTFTVYICGSESAVGPAVESALRALPYGSGIARVKRLEGTNRYETAAAIASEAELRSLRKNASVLRTQQLGGKEAFVFNGGKWTDGLAAGPVAAFGEAPVLMVGATSLPQATADWIEDNGVTAVHVVGGVDSVSAGVVTALESLSTTPTVDRIEGGDRYGTARAVAQYGVDDYGMYPGSVTLVSAGSPWDALSAGQLSFMTYAPLLLTSPTALSPQVTKFYDDNGGFHAPSYVVGGEGSVGAAPYTGLRDLWKRAVPK